MCSSGFRVDYHSVAWQEPHQYTTRTLYVATSSLYLKIAAPKLSRFLRDVDWPTRTVSTRRARDGVAPHLRPPGSGIDMARREKAGVKKQAKLCQRFGATFSLKTQVQLELAGFLTLCTSLV